MSIDNCHEKGCPENAASHSDFMKLCEYHYNHFMTPEEVMKDPDYARCHNCHSPSIVWISVHWAYGDLFTVEKFIGLCKEHARCDMGHPVASIAQCSSVPTMVLSGLWRLNPEKRMLKFCDAHIDLFNELCLIHPNSDRSMIAHKMLIDGNVGENVTLAPVEGPYYK